MCLLSHVDDSVKWFDLWRGGWGFGVIVLLFGSRKCGKKKKEKKSRSHLVRYHVAQGERLLWVELARDAVPIVDHDHARPVLESLLALLRRVTST